MQDKIIVKGARANNLKNIDVTIPRDKLVVMTGLSGSGKSSLAFDTICVSAGKIGAQVEVAPADLIALLGAQTADVTVE